MPDFEITDLKPAPFAYLKRTAKMDGIGPVMGQCFEELGRAFAHAGAQFVGPPLTHYLTYDGGSTTFEVGFPCRAEDADKLKNAGLSIGTTQAGRVMKATHVGSYESLNRTYDAMQAEMKARRLTGTREMWESYMSPPETPPEKTITQVIWPLAA